MSVICCPKKVSLLCLIFIFCLSVSVFAQEEEIIHEETETEIQEGRTEKKENISDIKDAIYVITAINFKIKGITKPYALIRNGEFKMGEILDGEEKLEKYIADKTQVLINQRVLKTARIDYTVGDIQPDGTYPVGLLIITEDTWNIIAVPYPKYDSNTGFNLTIKARDYNFLGSMNPLRLDIGYKLDEENHSSLLLGLTSDTPFTAFGYNWNLTFDNYFSYRPQELEPFFYQNTTGLSMELPVKRTTFTFGLYEYTILNEENADRYQPDYGKFQEGVYMSSKLSTSWKIPTGLDIGDYGELTYVPGIVFSINHEFPNMPLDKFRRGPILSFSHTLGFEKIDWIENYRRGLAIYLGNAYSYDFYKMDKEAKALSSSYRITGKGHFIISDFFAISVFLQFRHWFYHDPEYFESAGDALRGIMDKAVHADYMLSLNLDFPFRVFKFMPSQWLNNKKLSFFDFELHASPIIDVALYHDPAKNIPFNFKNILFTGGLEIIVFPAFMRSLYLRISFAWNFGEMFKSPGPLRLPEGDNREIFFGIGHHY